MCDCIVKVNETLKPHGAELAVDLNLTTGDVRPHLGIIFKKWKEE